MRADGPVTRLDGLRQVGAARIGLPRGRGVEGVLINTAGGLTAGDRMAWSAAAGPGAGLTLTTQACERIYRCDDGAADVAVDLRVGPGARLAWLPQETLLFDGARLRRRITADVAAGGSLLLVEPLLFGRLAMGEAVRRLSLDDRWHLHRGGRHVHAEATRLDSPAALDAGAGGMRALATVILLDDNAESHLAAVRRIIGQSGGASVIGDKLVCRLAAPDGYHLRKRLVPLVAALSFDGAVPPLWLS